jgi:hopene-associated glycosyltransferase HpnB
LIPGISLLSLAIWVYLLCFRGMFWRVSPLVKREYRGISGGNVAAIIPARDEEDLIGRAVSSLRQQKFQGHLRIYVVDDTSSDRTMEAAVNEGATVIQAGPLPTGWTGKMWAQSQGVKAALALEPDYFLFTDADIEHEPTSLQSLIDQNVALASTMVKLRCESLAERLLIPAFVFFFLKLYPPRWISDPDSATAGAAGGCILIRSEALSKIGGVESIRGELIDACALAAAVKPHGHVRLNLSDRTRSMRPYDSFSSIWNMVARTAFTQLRHSFFLLMGTNAAMFVTYIAPPLFALQGSVPAVAAWIAMSIAYSPMLRFYGQPLVIAPFLPVIAIFYLGATIHSAIRYWLGSGGRWKGRVQDRNQ